MFNGPQTADSRFWGLPVTIWRSFPYDADVEEEFFFDYNFWVKFIPTMLTLTDHMLF
jgi:hypothetical protein